MKRTDLFDVIVSQHTAFRNAVGLGAAFKKFVGNDGEVVEVNGFDSAGTDDGVWITVSDVKVSGDEVSGKAKIDGGEVEEFDVIVGDLKKVLTDANAIDGFEYDFQKVVNAIVKCMGRVKENTKVTLTFGQLKRLVKEGDKYLDDFVPLDSVRDWIENGDEETFDLEDDSDEDYEYIDSVMAIRRKHRDAQVKGNVPKGFHAKRCPKCGGMGIYYIDSDAMGHEVWGHIECAKCGAHVSEELEGPDEDREKEELIGILVDRWNKGDID